MDWVPAASAFAGPLPDASNRTAQLLIDMAIRGAAERYGVAVRRREPERKALIAVKVDL